MDDNPISFLADYGLDRLLTERDDPFLWAAAVKKHWPKPEALVAPLPRMLFGVCRIPDQAEEFHSQSGMECLESWRFQTSASGGLEPVRIEGETNNLYPEFFLEISRPSAGQMKAIVHAGDNPAPLIGYGEAFVWERQPDGSWEKTKERVSIWIS